MPRIRTIKPELATDKKLARTSRESRYTLVMVISQADDYGLLLGNARQLIGTLFPHDEDVSPMQLSAWIDELRDAGVLRWRETNDGARVLEVVNWQRHQKVDHPHKPVLRDLLTPVGHEAHTQILATPSREPRENLATSSRTDLTTVRPNDLTTRDLPAPRAALGGGGNGVGHPPRPRSARREPKYPHFTAAHRQAALDRWTTIIGPVPSAKVGAFHGALGPLFPTLERATALTPFELAEVVSRYAWQREVPYQSVHDFAAKFEHWWAELRRSRREDGQT